ncbi:cupin domain-containing protein [Streptomyces sp. NPDC058257]|uniref:cupin domain-containing protein n=1 Tax=Streptomyces sp. NPDC058257 TaxID=3346409 RepID=UPI0036EFF743
MTALVSRQATGSCRLNAVWISMPPGGATAVHHHGPEETVVYLIRGSARIHSGTDLTAITEQTAGQVVFIPGNCPHQVTAGPEGFDGFEVRSGATDQTTLTRPTDQN